MELPIETRKSSKIGLFFIAATGTVVCQYYFYYWIEINNADLNKLRLPCSGRRDCDSDQRRVFFICEPCVSQDMFAIRAGHASASKECYSSVEWPLRLLDWSRQRRRTYCEYDNHEVTSHAREMWRKLQNRTRKAINFSTLSTTAANEIIYK